MFIASQDLVLQALSQATIRQDPSRDLGQELLPDHIIFKDRESTFKPTQILMGLLYIFKHLLIAFFVHDVISLFGYCFGNFLICYGFIDGMISWTYNALD